MPSFPSNPRQDPAIRSILADWPDLPYRNLRVAPLHVLAELSARAMASDNVFIDPSGLGAAAWCPLPWDSENFGVSMARLDLLWTRDEDPARLGGLLDQVLQDLRARGVQHVAYRTDLARIVTIRLLEARGFRLVDGLQMLCCRPRAPQPGLAVRDYRPSDRDALLAVAGAGFQRTHTRYGSDPNLDPERAAETYVRWTDNCLAGRRGDWVGVRVLDGEPAGFITCLLHRVQEAPDPVTVGVIDLIAVNARFQGRGVGVELVRAAQNWLGPRSALLTTGTRCDNAQAIAMFTKTGYRIRSSKVGMHAWLG
jgi:ribosomal protein S18 acetylase RimI-like enzyme